MKNVKIDIRLFFADFKRHTILRQNFAYTVIVVVTKHVCSWRRLILIFLALSII